MVLTADHDASEAGEEEADKENKAEAVEVNDLDAFLQNSHFVCSIFLKPIDGGFQTAHDQLVRVSYMWYGQTDIRISRPT